LAELPFDGSELFLPEAAITLSLLTIIEHAVATMRSKRKHQASATKDRVSPLACDYLFSHCSWSTMEWATR
jgi:hypothetical protein